MSIVVLCSYVLIIHSKKDMNCQLTTYQGGQHANCINLIGQR
jgi:hypothetical protein